VDEQGNVVGVAFAIDRARDGTAYALAETELEVVLGQAGNRRAVATGPCLLG
jgi:hypothetical protein